MRGRTLFFGMAAATAGFGPLTSQAMDPPGQDLARSQSNSQSTQVSIVETRASVESSATELLRAWDRDALQREAGLRWVQLPPPPAAIAPDGRGLPDFGAEFDRLLAEEEFSPPASFGGADFRRWRDNTGAYQIEGRLAVIYPDRVRIVKQNGKTTTVMMRRLSSSDQQYVRWVAEVLTRDTPNLAEAPNPETQGQNPSR